MECQSDFKLKRAKCISSVANVVYDKDLRSQTLGEPLSVSGAMHTCMALRSAITVMSA